MHIALPTVTEHGRRAAVIATLIVLTQTAAALAPLGPVEPSSQEQHGIYVLNRARSDPGKYGQQIGVNLAGVEKRPPLAVNLNLTGSARFHAREMDEGGYFGHTSAVTGDGPNKMAVQNGYDLFGQGLGKDWTNINNIESIAMGTNSIATYASALALLIEDAGVPGLGHRLHLLGIPQFWADHREVGCGRATNGDSRWYAIHTGNVSASDRFITGVVYDDGNTNGRYDVDEGIGGVTVSAGAFSMQTYAQGGYALLVPAGTYTMTCSGGGFAGAAGVEVTVGSDSVEVDFRSGNAGAQVDFANEEPPAVPGPVVSLGAAPVLGTAPLLVDFTASTDSPSTTFAWDFGDGNVGAGTPESNIFATPGLYPVVLSGSTADGTTQALEVVAVGAAGGAGPGTTPPTSTDIDVRSAYVKAKFNVPGKDRIHFKGKLEMPAAFVPGSHAVEVCLAGVRLPFTLDERNKGSDAAGNKIKLKYKKPPVGLPLDAGVLAKLTVTIKGDHAAELLAAGFRDATEKRTLADVPFAFLLVGQPYRGTADLTQKSKAGSKSTARNVK